MAMYIPSGTVLIILEAIRVAVIILAIASGLPWVCLPLVCVGEVRSVSVPVLPGSFGVC